MSDAREASSASVLYKLTACALGVQDSLHYFKDKIRFTLYLRVREKESAALFRLCKPFLRRSLLIVQHVERACLSLRANSGT
jgi:hypothetical protein